MLFSFIHNSKIKLFFIIGAVGLAYFLFQGTSRKETIDDLSLPAVRVVEVTAIFYQDPLYAIGTTQAFKSVTLSPSVTETITKIHFRDGQKVREGDVIVDLSSMEESAQLDGALNTLKEKEAQYERSQKLFEKKYISQAKLDQDKRALKEARSTIRQLKARLKDRLITAPFSGILGLKDISLGALVQPGTPIVTLDKIDQIILDFHIPEKFLNIVRDIKTVQALSDAYPGHVFSVDVLSLDNRINPETGTFKVRGVLNNKDGLLQAGMFMRVQFHGKKRKTVFIPATALLSKGDEKFVYRYRQDHTLEEIKVEIGVRTRDKVEVLQGLRQGDLIVCEGLKKLRPGQKIKAILRKEE